MKYKCRFFQLLASFIVGILFPSSAYAYVVYGGTKNIKVGETITLETEPSTYYTVSGKWSKEGNACALSNKYNRSCDVTGVREGEATVRWTGVVGTADYEYYWYINVYDDNGNDNGGGNNSGGNSSDDNDTSKYETSWEDYYDISWYDKNREVFILSTNEELAGVAYLVNNGYTTFKGKTIKLGNDINLTGRNWTTIGINSSKPFEGSFDGQGHIISGIYVALQKAKQNEFGFWGVFEGSSILNTTFSGEIDVKNPDFDDNTSEWAIGGIAGRITSTTIEKCVSNMKVNFSILKSNKEVNVGGVCGIASAFAKIKRCSHIGDISIIDDQKLLSSQNNMLIKIGGIVGKSNNCFIERSENISSEILCYASGDNLYNTIIIPIGIGGISGNEGKITYCRSIINRIGLANESSSGNKLSVYLGGIIGGISSSLNVTNCYSVINVAELGEGKVWFLGGGNVYYGGVAAKSSASSSSKANFSNSDCAIDLPNWVTIDKQSGDNGDDSFSSEQMKTDNFLNQLNTYSIIEEGKGIWSPDENGYPCIAESHCMTGINRIVLNRDDLPIYRLNGQQIDKPRKGINIIGGKKVIVK